MDAAVHLVLRDADPNGIVTATRDNWTGKAISMPIADLGLMKEMLRSAGVYVLVGVLDDGSDLPAAYIGEAEEVVARLTSRHGQLTKTEVAWQRVVVFVSQAEDLHKGHIKWLEAKLIGRASAAGRVCLTNSTKPEPPKLPQFDLVFVEAFLSNMLVLYPLLGVSAFLPGSATRKTDETPSTSLPQDLLYLRKGGEIVAQGRCTPDGGIKLLAGSLISRTTAESSGPIIVRTRAHFETQGWLEEHDDNWWKLSVDYDCTSTSTAASLVLGRSVRGPQAWKNQDGVVIADLLADAAGSLNT
jgi:hypothetical protein